MSKLSKSRMRELIRSYGANPKRWPHAERQAGQIWLDGNAAKVPELLADAKALDRALNTVPAPTGGTELLQARILYAAKSTAQDGTSQDVAANDTAPILRTSNVFSAWKAVAATLVLTTGIGFGIGRVAAADTSYASAEALLSMSMQSDYIEADLLGDGV